MKPVHVLIGILLTVKAATLIFISGRGSAMSSAYEGKSGLFMIFKELILTARVRGVGG